MNTTDLNSYKFSDAIVVASGEDVRWVRNVIPSGQTEFEEAEQNEFKEVCSLFTNFGHTSPKP